MNTFLKSDPECEARADRLKKFLLDEGKGDAKCVTVIYVDDAGAHYFGGILEEVPVKYAAGLLVGAIKFAESLANQHPELVPYAERILHEQAGGCEHCRGGEGANDEFPVETMGGKKETE